MFAHSGLTPTEALRSATIGPARTMGQEEDYGTIAEGKYANFILLKEDPRQNLDTLDRPKGIWFRGADITNYLQRPWG